MRGVQNECVVYTSQASRAQRLEAETWQTALVRIILQMRAQLPRVVLCLLGGPLEDLLPKVSGINRAALLLNKESHRCL